MALLLDDDEDYICQPHKAARVEVVVTDASTTPRAVTARASVLAQKPNEEKRGIPTPLEVPLRGGNGMEKMKAFAFAGERSAVKLLPAASSSSSSSVQVSDCSDATASPESLIWTLKDGSQPSTIAKTMNIGSQSLSQANEVTSSTHPGSAHIDSSNFSPPPVEDNTNYSSNTSSSVSRQLFHESGATGTESTADAVVHVPQRNATPFEPKFQMKITDFFSQMACTKKR